MINFGKVRPGTTLYIPYDTFAGSTGASITQSGLAVTDIEVYKDGSTTQRSSDNGYTLLDTDGTDFDSLTGIHGFSISLADNTDAGFYAAGSKYFVVVSSVTIDGQTVSFLAATFQIGYPNSLFDTTIATLSTQTSFTLTSGPAEDDALNGCIVWFHDVASAVQCGWAMIQDYTGSTKTVTLSSVTTYTLATTDNVSIFTPTLIPGTAGRTIAIGNAGSVSTVDALGTQAKADVNAEVVDALATDTYAEPGQGNPAATTTLAAKLNYLYKAWRNLTTQTASTYKLYNDAGSTVDQKASTSYDGTTYTRNEIGTGP